MGCDRCILLTFSSIDLTTRLAERCIASLYSREVPRLEVLQHGTILNNSVKAFTGTRSAQRAEPGLKIVADEHLLAHGSMAFSRTLLTRIAAITIYFELEVKTRMLSELL